MVTLTLARYLRNKLILITAALFLAVPFANFINADFPCAFLLLLLSMLIFVRMVAEDAAFGTVDLRYTAILVLCLFLCSHYTASNYLFSLFSYLLLFRMMLIMSNLWAMLIPCQFRVFSKNKDTTEVSEELEDQPVPDCLTMKLPFLPCFFGGLFCFLLLLTILNGDTDIIWNANEILDACVNFLSGSAKVLLLFSLLLADGLLELVYYYFKKRKNVVHCFGMGDVIVLPNFAAFLGGSVFLIVLFFALLISLAFAVYQKTHRSFMQEVQP